MSGKINAFLFESGSGQVVRVHTPILLQAALAQAEGHEMLKAATATDAKGSRRIKQKIGTTIDGVLCAVRPFDPSIYAYAAVVNTYHSRACQAKAQDIVGRPWTILGDGPRALKAKIEQFFRKGFAKLSFGEGMEMVWADREAIGNGYLEVVPAMNGEPAEMSHLPATEMWIRLDEMGYVQFRNGEAAHFRDALIPKERYSDLPASDPLHANKTCSSVVHFSRYSPWSTHYGVPSIMTAWNALTLMVLVSEYNLQFFGNNAIPDYAVVLEGDVDDATPDVIREYFTTHLKGKAHKTLVLSAPSGGKIKFERLTDSGSREGSFRLLRTDCRDEILAAHGVPPQKVGIVETGKLGGNLASEQIFEYQLSIVGPGQEQVTGRFNRLIELWFGTADFTLALDGLDIDDMQINAQIDSAYLDRNVVTPNEVRARRYPELEPLPGGDEPLKPATLADLAGLEDQLAAIQRSLKDGAE